MMTLRLSSALCIMLFASHAVAAAPPGSRDDGREARAQEPENYCLGGIEHRKIIVGEGLVLDPFKETTRLGCEVDGGDPRTMPDLPTPTSERQRLA